MSVILERVSNLVYGGDWTQIGVRRTTTLLDDALDVIEKRNAEIDRLRAENERLRAACGDAIEKMRLAATVSSSLQASRGINYCIDTITAALANDANESD